MIDPQSELALVINNTKALEQITTRVENWQSSLGAFFTEFEEYANFFRLIEGTKRSTTSLTRTRVGETVRATEALTTSIFRMQTAADPCYDFISLNGAQSQHDLYRTSILSRYQDHKLKWKRRLLRADRSCVLFGTVIVETPWVQQIRLNHLIYEGLGFTPRSLLQCAFDPNVFFIEESPWMCFLDYYTEDQLSDLADADPENWNPEQVQAAIEKSKGKFNQSSKVEARRRMAGYRDMPLYEVATYYGRLRDLPREDGRLWMIRRINMDHVVCAKANPSPTGNIPFQVSRYLDFELEPYGYGVGRLGRLAQRLLDSNRERYSDVMTLALYNMWLKDPTSGIKNTDLKIKPLGIIEGDLNGLKPLTPDLNSVKLGLEMEAIYKAEHQGNTGATPNLQAQVTDASATESSIAQNEAIRRVSVIAEDMAESLVRDYQMEKHHYNLEWLQTDMWLSVTGEPPVRVNRFNIAHDVEVYVKMVTDKDFRPKRMENLKEAIQMGTSIRNVIPRNIELTPLFEEYFRGLGIDPSRVILPPELAAQKPPTIQEQLAMNMKAAHTSAQELGPMADGAMADAGIPGGSAGDTPVGTTLVTP